MNKLKPQKSWTIRIVQVQAIENLTNPDLDEQSIVSYVIGSLRWQNG